MKARIGVAESSKVIEIEVDDPEAFQSQVEAAFASEAAVTWFTDAKQRTVGVPVGKIAYVEIDSQADAHRVGFGPAG